MNEQCTNNGYTPFENAVQEAIKDLVSPDLAKPISTLVGSLHRAALTPAQDAGRVDFDKAFGGFGDWESEAYSRGVSIEDGDVEKLRLFFDYLAANGMIKGQDAPA